MADRTAYAERGLIGLLTPQANTTVEPEMAILMPPGVSAINARLVSAAPDMNDRLTDYVDRIDGTIAQFANAPVGAYAFGCTGASYLIGVAAEDALVTRIAAETGHPFISAALAVTDGLRALGATRIALVSPYPQDLTDASIGYWQARGFDVVEIVRTGLVDAAFHPIYAMKNSAAAGGLALAAQSDADAVLMLGTGMPTLPAIAEFARRGDAPKVPVLSCMLALGWRSVLALNSDLPTRTNIGPWVTGEAWAGRLPASGPS